MKNTVIWSAVLLMIASIILMLNANKNIGHVQKNLDQERYLRMVAEEKLEQASGEMRALQRGLSESEKKIQGIHAILAEGATEKAVLKAELENIARAKEELERKIADLEGKANMAAVADSVVP
ncbi:MAG: hypothetical protein WC552_07220 [Candidatus Omnitrophota bacterium]